MSDQPRISSQSAAQGSLQGQCTRGALEKSKTRESNTDDKHGYRFNDQVLKRTAVRRVLYCSCLWSTICTVPWTVTL